MKFWETSALLPLLIQEEKSPAVAKLYQEDPLQTVWCLSEVEAASALARRARKELDLAEAEKARKDLRFLAERWVEITLIENVRPRAIRLLNTHTLRAADALQLAAALVASDEKPESLPFVCLDSRVSEAARKEGFPVLPS
jgi:hypothetical protein